MKPSKPPKHYQKFRKQQPELFAAWEAIGKAVRETGPLDVKTGHLIQLAAAAAVRSEGAVHSHVRRLVALGAKPAEIRQAIMLAAGTIGFPAVMAALSWAEDILGD
jgi:alkylhydroperoxidase/carboxymuconolactone decarboxylase family protein YurZ